MRGDENQQASMFSYISLEQRIPAGHPLRAIRRMVDESLRALSEDFERLYARRGRRGIPPEQLLRALLLQVLYAIRSERQLMERIHYDLLLRWFVGLGMDDAEWDVTVFTKNRERLIRGGIAQRLLETVVAQARARQLLSAEHFTVDGTLLEAWASRNSFVAKDAATVVGTGARGRKCLRDTHESSSDAQARLYKKSTAGEIKASYLGHVITENRNGLVVAACATQSSATAEREAALAMLDEMGVLPDQLRPEKLPPEKVPRDEVPRDGKRITLGADKSYQEEKFMAELRQRQVAPHVAEYAPSKKWPNFLSAAERSDPGYAVSQKKRKLVERVFGWGKLNSLMRKIKLRGRERVDWFFRFLVSVHNLVRMVKLAPAQ